MCSPIKHDVVWKEGWEEQFDDSNRKPQHQQNYGAKNHLEDAEKDNAAVNIIHETITQHASVMIVFFEFLITRHHLLHLQRLCY